LKISAVSNHTRRPRRDCPGDLKHWSTAQDGRGPDMSAFTHVFDAPWPATTYTEVVQFD
jgi:hypothetical protein